MSGESHFLNANAFFVWGNLLKGLKVKTNYIYLIVE